MYLYQDDCPIPNEEYEGKLKIQSGNWFSYIPVSLDRNGTRLTLKMGYDDYTTTAQFRLSRLPVNGTVTLGNREFDNIAFRKMRPFVWRVYLRGKNRRQRKLLGIISHAEQMFLYYLSNQFYWYKLEAEIQRTDDEITVTFDDPVRKEENRTQKRGKENQVQEMRRVLVLRYAPKANALIVSWHEKQSYCYRVSQSTIDALVSYLGCSVTVQSHGDPTYPLSCTAHTAELAGNNLPITSQQSVNQDEPVSTSTLRSLIRRIGRWARLTRLSKRN